MSFYLEIISPDNKVFSGDVKKITVPSVTGYLTILTYHVPIFTPLQEGEVRITDMSSRVHKFACGKGFLEVLKDKTNVVLRPPDQTEEKIEKGREVVDKIKREKPKRVAAPVPGFRKGIVDSEIRKKLRKKKVFPEEQT